MRGAFENVARFIHSRLHARGGAGMSGRVHFVLDEVGSSVGHLDCLDAALDKGRAFGIRTQWYFQGVPQVKRCVAEGQEETLLTNVVQIFIATNSLESGNYISNRVGHSTIIARSEEHTS